MSAEVAVIGGGYAGCAAAVTLADAGFRVTLFESAPVLGGRARRVVREGLPLDNGQHLLLGAYAETLAMTARLAAGATPVPAVRRPLAIVPFGARAQGSVSLIARRAPGRLGLALGLIAARGLTWRERIANVRWMRALERGGFVRPPAERVAKMLAPLPPRVAQALWSPLCLAALNTPVERASAQVFANVLRAAFAGAGDASDFVLPATDLTAFLPDRAAARVASAGGDVRTNAAARVVAAARDSVTLAVGGQAVTAGAAIVAVGPHQLDRAFASEALAAHPPLAAAVDLIGALAYEPIVTIWLGYPQRVALPAPIARLDDAPGQWVVDRPDILARADAGAAPAAPPLASLLAVVVSASGAHERMTHAALAAAADAQLRRLAPGLAPCAWSQVIAEQRATYACTPGRVRPAGPRLAPGLYLAGDYVDAEYPATLEAAVRSGIAAARALVADRG